MNRRRFAFARLSVIDVSFHDLSKFFWGGEEVGDRFCKSELYVCGKRFTAPQLSARGECHLEEETVLSRGAPGSQQEAGPGFQLQR